MDRMTETYPRWILITERLPEEHDSIFAKLKATDKWKRGMFTRTSDNVLVTIEDEINGLRMCEVSKTIDGVWKTIFSEHIRMQES